ncbi:MAG: DUF1538 domain-containing protein [Tepidanaerobacter sp.]|jgi:hypothetical protein|nr:DUF1538 domain-containing protein [Tepidanaerobacter sp.]
MQNIKKKRGSFLGILARKFTEVSYSVLPITVLVIILHFTLIPIETEMLARFIIGAILVIIGLGIFLFGAEIGIVPIGNLMGETIAKTNNSYLVGILGFILGFLITVAEPDLQILARQVNMASGGIISDLLILIVVSIGVGIMVGIGLLRILYEKPLNRLLTLVYFIIFLLGIFTSQEFLAISVDASGATTGAMTTPFILALGYGVSQLKGGKTSEEDSFGMVGLASAGPIFAVMAMSIISGLKDIAGTAEAFVPNTGILQPYFHAFPKFLKESLLTLFPLFVLFMVFDKAKFKLNKKHKHAVLKGLLYTFIGLTLFLVGVNAGFMEVGRVMGQGIAKDYFWLLPVIGFFLGMVVVLAEPAVYVLTEQVEDVTAGHIKKKAILATLSIGIAFAVVFSMMRIMIPSLKLWHFLLPGFAFAAFLSYRVPPIFVGIAYDSGGVASGPMTATFVLAFAQGAANAIPTANVMVDGFGVIAMVAMMPLVAIQILGLIYKMKAGEDGQSQSYEEAQSS